MPVLSNQVRRRFTLQRLRDRAYAIAIAALFVTVAGLVLLEIGGMLPRAFGSLTLGDLTSRSRAWDYFLHIIGASVVQWFVAMLVAALAAAVPRRVVGWRGGGMVFAGATGATVALASITMALSQRGWPPLVQLTPPILGSAIGSGLVILWRLRGWARWSILPLGVLAALIPLVVLRSALSTTPLPFTPARVTSDDKRRLVELVRGAPISWGDDYEAHEYRFTGRDANLLANWVIAMLDGQETSSKVELAFTEGGLQGQCALQLPGTRPCYLNVQAEGTASVQAGKPSLSIRRLQIGRLRCPSPITWFVGPLIISYIHSEPELERVAMCVQRTHLAPDQLSAVIHKDQVLRDVVPQFEFIESPLVESTLAQLAYLRPRMPQFVSAPDSFERIHEAAFSLAAARSEKTSAVTENRAALLALGILLGHPKLGKLILGDQFTAEDYYAVAGQVGHVPMRERRDWTRHFAVGAALAVHASPTISDAMGLLKEELDAGEKGSGFSFCDLTADMAGTRLAVAATRSEAAALTLQLTLARSCNVDDIFPPAADLPEGIDAAELEREYGGVEGPRYRATMQQIERRLANCRLLRAGI